MSRRRPTLAPGGAPPTPGLTRCLSQIPPTGAQYRRTSGANRKSPPAPHLSWGVCVGGLPDAGFCFLCVAVSVPTCS